MAYSFTNNSRLLTTTAVLFFVWGVITILNDLLVPLLKEHYQLTYFSALLVQFCFFIAYLILSLPMAKLLNQLDFKKALIVGLIIIIIGCCLFCITPHVTDYVVFLVALFVLAAGVVMLQVSANTLTTLLGNAETASARLSFAQGLNSLGYIITPLIISGIISMVILPNVYITIAILLAMIILFIIITPFQLNQPSPNLTNDSPLSESLYRPALIVIWL